MTSDLPQAKPGDQESANPVAASIAAPAEAPCPKAAEKEEVRTYFESTGFERWNRIYSDSEDVNKVQRNIRLGHQKTVDAVLAWLQEQGDLPERSFCDAGCGVGSLALPLAALEAGSVLATDLSEAMVSEARRRAAEKGLNEPEKIEREFVATATLVTGGRSIPVDGGLTITVRYSGDHADD